MANKQKLNSMEKSKQKSLIYVMLIFLYANTNLVICSVGIDVSYDLNQDGKFDIDDVKLAASMVVGREPIVDEADVNMDNKTTVEDVLLLSDWIINGTPTPTPTPVVTPSPSPTPTPIEITIYLPDNVPLVLVKIPKGSFEMGSPDSERSRRSHEGPIHMVSIEYDFYLGKTEITQRQWLALMINWPGAPPSATYGVGDDYPAYFVSWHDAQNFVSALNDHIISTNQGSIRVRLPSEAEWEYSCRSGSNTRFYFGDSLGVDDDCEDDGIRSDHMWYCGNKSTSGAKPVGQKKSNLFGLYDMHGNLWEWCEDWYHDTFEGSPSDGSAWVTPTTTKRVGKGGTWFFEAWLCRSASRGSDIPTYRNFIIGFRIAADQ